MGETKCWLRVMSLFLFQVREVAFGAANRLRSRPSKSLELDIEHLQTSELYYDHLTQ